MPDLLDFSLATVDRKKLLGFFDFVGAAKYVASETPTPLDDISVNQLADVLREWLLSQFDPQPAFVTFAAPPPVDADQIVKAADALGVELSPFMVSVLLQFAWPVIERLLKRWAK
jgi:hypothetical protein